MYEYDHIYLARAANLDFFCPTESRPGLTIINRYAGRRYYYFACTAAAHEVH